MKGKWQKWKTLWNASELNRGNVTKNIKAWNVQKRNEKVKKEERNKQNKKKKQCDKVTKKKEITENINMIINTTILMPSWIRGTFWWLEESEIRMVVKIGWEEQAIQKFWSAIIHFDDEMKHKRKKERKKERKKVQTKKRRKKKERKTKERKKCKHE